MTNELSIRFKYAYDYLVSIDKVSGYKDFALKLGISTSMITEVFKGRSNVGTTALQSLVISFDINGNWLFTGQGEMIIQKGADQLPSVEQFTSRNESILYTIYKEKDTEVGTLKEEIGRLKEQIERLKNNERPISMNQH